jgi:ankyrin repeat protein
VCLQGGKKLLHWAAQLGDSDLVRKLLDDNPVSDLLDLRGNGPLHLAVLNNHK